MPELSGLFSPDRVAVIGATERGDSVGLALMENLSTFDGDVIPVNPNRETVLGVKCYPEIGELQTRINEYRAEFGVDSPEEAVIHGVDIDQWTLRAWQTARRNLGIARAALAVSEAEENVLRHRWWLTNGE